MSGGDRQAEDGNAEAEEGKEAAGAPRGTWPREGGREGRSRLCVDQLMSSQETNRVKAFQPKETHERRRGFSPLRPMINCHRVRVPTSLIIGIIFCSYLQLQKERHRKEKKMIWNFTLLYSLCLGHQLSYTVKFYLFSFLYFLHCNLLEDQKARVCTLKRLTVFCCV